MPPAPTSAEMLAEMGQCAYRLGKAFAAAAEAEDNWKRKLEFFRLFDRCFFAVRVGIALELRLARAARWTPAQAPARAANEDDDERAERAEALEVEGAERPERLDYDRDRETERASLPLFLDTLKAVAADAAALPGEPPAELPALQALLAKTTPGPPSPQPRAAPLRDRLAGSAALAVATLPRPPPGLPPRRSTGPPRH